MAQASFTIAGIIRTMEVGGSLTNQPVFRARQDGMGVLHLVAKIGLFDQIFQPIRKRSLRTLGFNFAVLRLSFCVFGL
jgi:hypothetical protein